MRTDVHQLHQPRAWAADADHIERLHELGARGVRLVDEHGREWTAPLAAWDAYAIAIDRGHGRQLALPLAHWTVRDGRQPALPGLGA